TSTSNPTPINQAPLQLLIAKRVANHLCPCLNTWALVVGHFFSAYHLQSQQKAESNERSQPFLRATTHFN
ncbi:hypothetical protein, partial [Limosilactobacillus fermentum]|uniref:hypothetical protein n=1 Tax=Limosilactobacillus fermentum TaxID=1613 RepID=UPI002F261CDB